MLKKFCFFIILFLLISNLCHSQSWIWAKGGAEDSTNGVCEPIEGIAVDSVGNIFETGVYSGAFSLGSYVFKTYSIYTSAAYLAKYSPGGALLWAISSKSGKKVNVGATSRAVTTDKRGNCYIIGTFCDSLTIGTTTLYTSNTGTYANGFYAKFDKNGNFLWLKSFTVNSGASGIEPQHAIIDPFGYLYITGYFQSSVNLGSFNINSGGGENPFLAKLDSNGNPIWLKTPNTANYSSLFWYSNTQIVSDPSGNIYFAGPYTGNITMGSVTLTKGNTYGNIFVFKLDSNGNALWGITTQSPATNSANYCGFNGIGLTIDPANNIYLSGNYNTTLIFGAFTRSNYVTGEGMGFLAKIHPNGNVEWLITANTNKTSLDFIEAFTVSADKWGHIYWCGFLDDTITLKSTTIIWDSAFAYATYIMELDTAGNILCYSLLDADANGDGFNGAVADPITPDAYITGPIVEHKACLFDTIAIKCNIYPGISGVFMAKWACSTCLIPAKISGPASICKGQSVVLKASGGTSYFWSNGATTDSIVVKPALTTTYDLSITKGACFGDTSFTITVIPSPTPLISSAKEICTGDSVLLDISGGVTYLWSTGSTTTAITVKPTTDTSYFVTLANGSCTAKDSVVVDVFKYPVAGVSARQSICAGNMANISASGGKSYLWNTGDTLDAITVTPSLTSTYTVTLYNGPCTVKDSVEVIVNPLPPGNVCCDSSINLGQSITLTANGGTNYTWLPVDGLSCSNCSSPIASPNENTTYTVTIISDSGCSTSVTVTIDVTCHVFVPDAFSPNNDGENDILYVRGKCIQHIEFAIYNRWGNKVFETENINTGWDGTYKGQPEDAGTYVYILKAILQDGSAFEKKGNITLVR